MKRSVLLITSLVFGTLTFSQTKSKGILGGVKDAISKTTKGGTSSALSNDEIIAGLKEALSQGATNSSGKLSTVDGFFKDAAVKILMPEQVQKVEKKMRTFGMGKMVDNAILSMNRAAEDASKSAAPIFLNAIKGMSVSDALNILRGTDTAATGYLKKSTTNPLTEAFRPIVEESLKKVDATKYWKDVFETYNKLPTTFKKVNTDLSGHVTDKALGGLFYQVALEEQKIRKDPAARVTDVLKKVFAN